MEINSRKIAKNSLWLYLRMLVVTLVSLYTSRIVLKAIGIDDFGIYNVAGGVIAFMAMITAVMAGSTQRYLNVYKGEDDLVALSNMMNISISLHIFIGILLLIIGETIGLFVVAKLLNFPESRYFAAIMVYQASLLALMFAVFKTPYISMVITYERFSFIAFLSFFEAIAKLFIAYCLLVYPYDSLILYGFSFAIVEFLLYMSYRAYSSKLYLHRFVGFKELRKSNESKSLIKFSMWSLLGNVGSTSANHGINIILNFFFPLSVNAAMGITNQVTNSLATFVNNVQIAFRPQLLQSFTNKDGSFTNLVCSASKWSFILMMFVCLPLIGNLHLILSMWLGTVPYYAYHFIIILIVFLIIDTLSTPLSYGIDATGKIAKFQILSFSFMLMNVLLAFGVCEFGFSPPVVIFTKVVTNIAVFSLRLRILLENTTEFSLFTYYRQCVRYIFPISIYVLLCFYITLSLDSLSRIVFSTLIYYVGLIPMIYIFALNKAEKDFFKRILLRVNNDR